MSVRSRSIATVARNVLSICAFLSLLLVAGCGAVGSSSTTPPVQPTTYTIGGTISGLTGTGLVLQDNGGNNLSVSAGATTFAFSTAIASGATYSVTVLTEPSSPSQTCVVTNGSGTVGTANVTSVEIACTTTTGGYTIGGTITGLTGTGLVLQNNGGNNLSVGAGSSTFTFTNPITSGGAYSVTVLTQPSSPSQICTVTKGSGTVANANVTNVAVSCTTTSVTYTIGGTISGLTGTGLVLQDNGGNNLSVSAGATTFTFTAAIPAGSTYSVTIFSQPSSPTQTCTVSNATGTATANVTSVAVNCGGGGALNEWTWVSGSMHSDPPGTYGTLGTVAPGNVPGGRDSAASWVDPSGSLWVFGGQGPLPTSGTLGYLNDLWRYSAGEWTWMAGSNVPDQASGSGPSPRTNSATWADAAGNLWLFGGNGYDAAGNVNDLNDLWKYSAGSWTRVGGSNTAQKGTYGTLGTPSASNIPGSREGALTWTDAAGNFWLFGGQGFDSTGTSTLSLGYLNDLWEYSAGEWTWMGGSNLNGQSGVYGIQGTPAPGNHPGGRGAGVTWLDAAGNLWLFGGWGLDSVGATLQLNDLWKYSAGQWTWMAGSNLVGQGGTYGVQGTSALGNIPGARSGAVSWTDANGNFWLFGGGIDNDGITDWYNDFWKYSAGQWTWVGGFGGYGPGGTYGTQGTPSPGNIPGARIGPVSWKDPSGNFWLFGGYGWDSAGVYGELNDLWEYSLSSGITPPSKHSIGGTVSGLSGTGLVLQDNGGDNLPVTTNGGFTFPTTLATGSRYDVTILTQPSNPSQTCTITNGSGTVASASVTNVQVTCATSTVRYSIGGKVSGLSGAGLVLQDNGGDNLAIAAGATTFTFITPLATGSTYSVTVIVQPSNPSQLCTVTNGSGTVTGANVTTVQVTCATTSFFAIGGTVSNLAGTGGGLQLQDNGTDSLLVNANGTFTFPTSVAGGTTYSVTVSVQPSSPAQTCVVTNGRGTVTANVTNVVVDCGYNEWKWMGGSNVINQKGAYGTQGTPAASNVPGARYAGAAWTDLAGNFWLFGGYGYDSTGSNTWLNDLWKYSAGQWTWMTGSNLVGQKGTYGNLGTAAAGNTPGARSSEAAWTDAAGNFWLFGGYGFDSAGASYYLNDLWEYSAGEWKWVGGSNVSGQKGTYGNQGTAAAGNTPGARSGASSWTDAAGNLWLFGGVGLDSAGAVGRLNDLWKYSGGEWTWMSGSNVPGQKGIYGAQGVAAAGNTPGARNAGVTWVDTTGNLWLFGGSGYDSAGNLGNLNDLWMYSAGQWTWVGGSNLSGQKGVYGTEGTAAASNVPGARVGSTAWSDASGNFWLFGGTGFDSQGPGGELSDLWKYKYSSGEWTWMGGPNVAGQKGTYGTQGSPSPGNVPGARDTAFSWRDKAGNFWLFAGGNALDSAGGVGQLNDLWEYQPTPVSSTIGYAYVVINYGNGPYAAQYTIGANGALAPTGTNVAVGHDPTAMVVDPTGRYAYVSDASDGAVYQYTIGASGKLTPMSPATAVAEIGSKSIVVDPTGRYVYVGSFTGSTVWQYSIGSGGELTPIGPPAGTGAGPTSVTVDPSGRYVYVANSGWIQSALPTVATVSQYSIGPTGTLTPLSPASVTTDPTDVQGCEISIAVTSAYAYAASCNKTYEYTIGSTGALSPMSPASVAVGGVVGAPGVGSVGILIDPTSRYVYEAGGVDGDVLQLTIGAGGQLTSMTPPSVGAGGIPSLAFDPTGSYLYDAWWAASFVSQFAIGPAGHLEPLSASYVNVQNILPVAIATVPVK